MTMPQCCYVFPRIFFAALIALVLAACSTEDNIGTAGMASDSIAVATGSEPVVLDTGFDPIVVDPVPDPVVVDPVPDPIVVGPVPDPIVVDPGSGGQIALSWIAPVEREDGTPISMAEIKGYRVYFGLSQDNLTEKVYIDGANTMEATLSNLASGFYYVAVTTLDMDGRESAFSAVVTSNI